VRPPPNYNYRVTWKQGQGYRGEYLEGGQWYPCHGHRETHADAQLDCRLDAKLTRKECRLDPVVQPGK
jgi:hypothetical protein